MSRIRALYLLIALYLIFRLIHLTLLPIFNDESIYLQWGWREIQSGNLYYSLYDAKQPLLMWIFAASMHIFSDPLFAGRVISVLFGLGTMLGIYKIADTYFSKRVAYLSAVLYIFTPIFMFYDRQALMESSIGAIGIWSFFYILQMIDKPKYLTAGIIGLLLGIGFFIKSSSIIFIITTFIILGYALYKKTGTTSATSTVKYLSLLLGAFFCVDLLLFIQPTYWQTLSSNSRYGFTLNDLLHFPIFTWVQNLWGNVEISFLFLSPFIFIFALYGIYILLQKPKQSTKYLLLWLGITFLLQTLLIKSTSQRYLVSFLPLLLIPSSIGIYTFIEVNLLILKTKSKYFSTENILLSLLLIPSIIICLILLFNPPLYLQTSIKLSQYADSAYVRTFTTGYGVPEAVAYLNNLAQNQPILVTTAINTGNPESAMEVYFDRSPNVRTSYLDQQMFGNSLAKINCLTYSEPLYFVSREHQLAGMDKYLQEIKRFQDPYDTFSIGVYTLKKNCTDKTLNLQ